jgi:hypothetical protein
MSGGRRVVRIAPEQAGGTSIRRRSRRQKLFDKLGWWKEIVEDLE